MAKRMTNARRPLKRSSSHTRLEIESLEPRRILAIDMLSLDALPGSVAIDSHHESAPFELPANLNQQITQSRFANTRLRHRLDWMNS